MSRHDEVDTGEELPPFTVAITLQRLVMEAGANRDFSPIHYDRDAAIASGAPDVFANTTFNETLLEAAIREWAGPGARIRMIEFAMRDNVCVGDVAVAAGRVTGKAAGMVELDVWIETARGRPVQGRAMVEI